MAQILVIEDNATMREGIVQILNKVGHEAKPATGGKEGLALFKEHRPDFVISDLKMEDLDGIEVLANGDEPSPVDDALDSEQLFVGASRVAIGNDDCGGDVAERDVVGAEFLQCCVSVSRLGRGIGVDQRALAVEHHLANDSRDRLSLGEPVPPQFGQVPRGLGFVERDPARHPAIGKAEIIESIEDAGCRRVRKA